MKRSYNMRKWAVIFLVSFGIGSRISAEERGWPEYQAIMWVAGRVYKDPQRVGLFFERMREMGITAVTLEAEGNAERVLTNGLGYYVENIVNRGLCLKFNSKVTDWDWFVTKWAKNGRTETDLVRDFCLDDPGWREQARRQMREAAKAAKEHRPLLYDIRDELSVTISANPFDYDFGEKSLEGFREWLKRQYGSVKELNEEWQTEFGSWNEVRPFTTDRIKQRMASKEALPKEKVDWSDVQSVRFDAKKASEERVRWNFSPWADFRSYMDLALARTLDDLRSAAREVDSETPVGIEGTQMPSAWGGYDLWRLSQAVDWVEPYDIGNAREIFGSFMPGKPIVSTVFESETKMAQRRLWHLLLEGDKGCIIWWSEDCIDWNSSGYELTAKAQALSPVLKELRSPLANIFMRAKRQYDPVAIHYSQASIQVDWLIESTVDGSTWLRRFSSFEADHNRMARVRESWVKAVQDAGFSPRFISSEQIERGELKNYKALVLAQSLALSEKEAEEIRKFSENGIVFGDGTPGMFDGHGKLRERLALGEIFGLSNSEETSGVYVGGKREERKGDISLYKKDRLKGESGWAEWVKSNLKKMKDAVEVSAGDCVRVHQYRLGDAELLGLERNISYQMSEDLKQAGGNQALEKPIDAKVELRTSGHVYDLRSGKYLGEQKNFVVHIDPWQPTLLVVLKERAPGESVIEWLGKQRAKD